MSHFVQEGDESGLEENAGDGDGNQCMTIAVPGHGFKKVTINTSEIQEKAQATRAVYEHAKAMGASFGPYVQACLDVFLPLVNFKYSPDVRSTAAQTLSAVFDAACAHGEQVGMQIPQKYLPSLADAISKQVAKEDTADMEAVWALADSLSEIYYIVHRFRNSPLGGELLEKFSLQHAEQSVKHCMEAMVSCLERRSNIAKVLSGTLTGEDEHEEYVSMLSEEEKLLVPLVDSVGYTLKFFRRDFVPLFEKYVVPVLGSAVTSNSDVRASVSAICLFDDVVEHCGDGAAAKFSPQLLKGVLMALEDSSDKELLEAAVYGVAQVARYAPSQMMSVNSQAIIHRLMMLTSRSKDEAGDDVYLVEIAASALASMTLFGPFQNLKFVSREALITTFLSHLPLQRDEDEAKVRTETSLVH